jgi:ATPase subunit of ABC transporter with duplicated ATPase domains
MTATEMASKADAALKTALQAEAMQKRAVIAQNMFFRKLKGGALAAATVAAGVFAYCKYLELKEDYIKNHTEPEISKLPLQKPLPINQARFYVGGDRGKMLLGPTGAGKTTLLKALAYNAAHADKHTPVAYVSVRLSPAAETDTESDAFRPEARLEYILERVCAAIDYPEHSSVAAMLMKRVLSVMFLSGFIPAYTSVLASNCISSRR